MSLRLGLIGHPVKHSLSPPMHRAALSFFGLAGSYDLFDIEPIQLEDSIRRLQKSGLSGFNVTIPHKEAVLRLLSRHSPEACLVGAANTVRIDSAGQLTAHNTDLGGFRQVLRHFMHQHLGADASFAKKHRVLVLGAGGVARACIAGLLLEGCTNLVLAARRIAQAEEIGNSICHEVSSYLNTSKFEINLASFDRVAGLGAFSLVINCTSVGLASNDEAAWFDSVIASTNQQTLFFDSVYMKDNSPTLLMKLAIAHGISSVGGLNMLVEQAALAFEYWTGRRPSSALLYDVLPCMKQFGAVI